MAQSYCGKSCENCERRIETECPGCKYGPGTISGGCSIAKCCIDNGLPSCERCEHRDGCETLSARETAAEERFIKLSAIKLEEDRLKEKAPLMGKYLWIVFWLIIANMICNLVNQIAGAAVFGSAAGLCFCVAIAFCFRNISRFCNYYARVSKLYLVLGALNVVNIFFGSAIPAESIVYFSAVLLVIQFIISFMCEYNEYMGHAEQTESVDNALSFKWRNIWRLYIYSIFAVIVSLLVMIIVPTLGAMFFMASGFALLAISLMRIKYLYDTAFCFRDIAKEITK